MAERHLDLVALNGSPSATSKTHAVAATAVECEGAGTVVDLGSLDAGALLGRSVDPATRAALDAVAEARVLLIVTPTYRATFSGLLKVFFDLLPNSALTETVCILAATGGSEQHYLALDNGLRPMVASMGGLSVPTAVYLTGADFDVDNALTASARALLETALGEARLFAAAYESR